MWTELSTSNTSLTGQIDVLWFTRCRLPRASATISVRKLKEGEVTIEQLQHRLDAVGMARRVAPVQGTGALGAPMRPRERTLVSRP